MSTALRIRQGRFGRAALLDMDGPLIVHAHPHCHVLVKAAGADTRFLIQDRLQPLTDDTAVLVNAWERHAYVHVPAAPRTVILALYVDPGWLSEVQTGLAASASPGFFSSPCVAITPRIRALADRLTEGLLYGGCGAGEDEALLLELMIAVIDRFSEWRTLRGTRLWARPPAVDFRVRRAIDYLQANLDETLDAGALAREAGLSRAHFFRLFQQATRLTPAVFLNVLRMEAAIEGLTRTADPLAVVSDRLGFSAQGHFTRFFRNHLGITPSEYRRVVRVAGRTRPAGPGLPA